MANPNIDRRQFLQTSALGAVGFAAGLDVAAAKETKPTSETLVAHFYSTLGEDQKATMHFDFDDPLRSRVENNWHITPARIGQFFNREQQALIQDIFFGMHNPKFHKPLAQHLRDDAGGLEGYSVALFGEPGTGKFEFVVTGRHMTARCDGDSVDGAAFGGPIFYGHEGDRFVELPTHPGNVYWFQALRANEVFQALDGKQRETALRDRLRRETGTSTVALRANPDDIPGLPVADMSRDQRDLVDKVLEDLLLPFREADRNEAMKLIHETGGVESLKMSFSESQDTGNDGVWDVWELESPNMVWHFRGAPHVHTYVNIQREAGWQPPDSLGGGRGSGRMGRRRGRFGRG